MYMQVIQFLHIKAVKADKNKSSVETVPIS